MINALSIDVEDYWSIISRDWLHRDTQPTEAVVRNTQWFLETLADYNVKATFFILGEVAKKFPQLVKTISDQGHEIGSHGYFHRQVFKVSEEEFRQDISDSKKLLEDITSAPVAGHRAAAFSIMPETKWALEVLAEEGFEYDSSVFPIAGKRYGWGDFSKDICRIELGSGRSIIEVPMSTISLGIKELGVGGGYLRHFPYIYTKFAINHIQKKRPAVLYMHPYEIDTEVKKLNFDNVSGEQKRRVIKFHKLQMHNRKSVKNKISELLNDFKFTTITDLLNDN